MAVPADGGKGQREMEGAGVNAKSQCSGWPECGQGPNDCPAAGPHDCGDHGGVLGQGFNCPAFGAAVSCQTKSNEHFRGKTPAEHGEKTTSDPGDDSARNRAVEGLTPRKCSCCGSVGHRSGECPHVDVGDYAESAYNGL